MKAISLHQPYASLIADGVKHEETRSWKPPMELIGERIAIHAALKCDHLAPERRALYPFGAVVATAVLWDAIQVDHATHKYRHPSMKGRDLWIEPNGYGDFSHGRWIWVLHAVVKLPEPIPAKGRQGFWNWEKA